MPNRVVYAIKRRIMPGFRPRRGDLVVDIGSGDKPFWRADVLVDSVAAGDEQRHSGRPVETRLGAFVESDVTRGLPFADGAFDFSYCSHLLEHLPAPGVFLEELTRVSRAGYIEVPNGMYEVAEPFVSHLWLVFRDGQRLVFVRKSKAMHDALHRNRASHSGLRFRVLREPFIRLYWEGSVDYEIVDELSAEQRYDVGPESVPSSEPRDEFPRIYAWSVRLLRRVFRRHRTSSSLDG